MAKKNIQLREMSYAPAALKVDRDAGVIRGVRIIGAESLNGRTYSPQAIRDAAKHYEGVSCNIDHSSDNRDANGGSSERSIRDFFGNFREVTCTDTEATGDLHYLKSHPLAEQICEAAERMPNNFGLSHVATGVAEEVSEGRIVVESISEVSSVDLVTRPATNKGLFESIQIDQKKSKIGEKPMAKVKTTPRKLLESAGEKGKAIAAKIVARCEKFTEADPLMAGVADPMAMDSQMEMESPAEDASPEELMKQARNAQIIAIADNDSMDDAAKLSAIQAILEAHGAIKTAVSGGDAPPPAAGDAPVAESVKLKARITQLEGEQSVRKLLEAADVAATDELVEAVAMMPAGKRAKLIESFPKRKADKGGDGDSNGLGDRPEHSFPLEESIDGTPVSERNKPAKGSEEMRKRYA